MVVHKSHTLRGKPLKVKHWEMPAVAEIPPFTMEAKLKEYADGDPKLSFPTSHFYSLLFKAVSA